MRKVCCVMCFALSLLILTGCGDAPTKLSKGQAVPGFTLERLDGEPLRFPDDVKGKVVAIRFWADWCPPCRLMKRQLFADPEVAADLNSRFVPVRVRDRSRAEGRNRPWVDSLETRFRVSAFPTLVAESLEGGEPARIEGYLGRAGTLRQLRAAAARLRREESGAARTGAVSE